VTLLSLQYLVTENADISAITIGFNSFYHNHQVGRDREAGKYLLLQRK
tara:strand:+ start:374 stop:517 length:144 start_codon:yes stop_codon:yes gene_type:complete